MTCVKVFLVLLVVYAVCFATASPVVEHRNALHQKSTNLFETSGKSEFQKRSFKINNRIDNDIGKIPKNLHLNGRPKREYDVNIEAEYEEETGTDLSAEISGVFWKTNNARLEGKASVTQSFNEFGSVSGKRRVGAGLHFHHD